MKKMILLFSLATASLFANCEVDVWKFKQDSASNIIIDGLTSCSSGKLALQVYDGEGNYIGDKTTEIKDGTFTANISGQAPDSMKIEYSISI